MVKLNLDEANSNLIHASTEERKTAILNYISIASELILDHGSDTDFWPTFALDELMKAGRAAYEKAGDE